MKHWLAAAIALAALAYDPSAPAVTPKTAALGLVGIVALAMALPSIARGDRAAVTGATAAWCALCGWLALSLVWSDHAVPFSVALPAATAAIALAAGGIPLDDLRGAAARAAITIALVSSAVALWQRQVGLPVHGLQGSSSWLGLVLAAAWPLCAERARTAAGVERGAAVVATALAAAALFASGSRSGWLAGAAGALILIRGRWRYLSIAVALGVGTYAVRYTDWWHAWDGRLWIWQRSLDAGLARPLLGHGTGRFGFAFLDAQGQALARLSLDDAAVRFVNATTAHHDALHVFVEGGVVAAALLFAALALPVWLLRERWRGGSALALSVAVGGLGDVPIQQPAVLGLLALTLAACPRLAPRRVDGGLAAAALLCTALILPRVFATWIGERRLSRAMEAPLRERTLLLTRAAETSPHAGQLALELGLAHLALGEPGRALPWLERSGNELANVGTDIALGNAHLALGDAAAAIAAFRRALARQPARFAARANLVEALVRDGQLDAADRELERAREVQPHHPKLRDMAERLRRAHIDAETKR